MNQFQYKYEDEMLQKAFKRFLINLKTKNKIEILYYSRIGRTIRRDYAFVGFINKKGGKHGLHYSHNTRAYYFGIYDKENRLEPTSIYMKLQMLVPDWLKQKMIKVSDEQRSLRIKVPGKEPDR